MKHKSVKTSALDSSIDPDIDKLRPNPSGALAEASIHTIPGLAEPEAVDTSFVIEDLCASFGDTQVLHHVDMTLLKRQVTAIIGPSGCGKSTFIRCLNRMHETTPGADSSGQVIFEGGNIYDADIDPVLLRRRVGMVFQKPNPFPTMSIRNNVLAGLTLRGEKLSTSQRHALVEKALTEAALWEEVKTRLDSPAIALSGGQQQRLCIARSLAVAPQVLLMDEPCSALDPIATARIEDLIQRLRDTYTIIIVTHNMQQAARVSSQTAFLLSGQLIECAPTDQLFTTPRDPRTEDYITGKFG